jgi:hypothetical protein
MGSSLTGRHRNEAGGNQEQVAAGFGHCLRFGTHMHTRREGARLTNTRAKKPRYIMTSFWFNALIFLKFKKAYDAAMPICRRNAEVG